MEGLDKPKRKDKLHTRKFTNEHQSSNIEFGDHRQDMTYKVKI